MGFFQALCPCFTTSEKGDSKENLTTLENMLSNESLEELIKQYKERNKIDGNIFGGITVKSVNGKDVLMSDLWKKGPIILKVLARLGCTLCMHEAKLMSDLQPFFEAKGIKLIAVVFEDVDLKSFLKGGYWKWDIYIDPERKVYNAAKLYKVSRLYHMSCMVSKSIMQLMVNLNLKGMVINFKGDLRQLGGTFVIDQNGTIKYDFRPKKFAVYPSMKEIYASVGGDPDDIDDELPEEYVYTQNKLIEDTIRSSRSSSLFSFNTL